MAAVEAGVDSEEDLDDCNSGSRHYTWKMKLLAELVNWPCVNQFFSFMA